VPEEIKQRLSELNDSMNKLMRKVIEAETPSKSDLTREERKKLENHVLDLSVRLGECASLQLSNGRALEGGQFQACFVSSPFKAPH